jgi:AraC-like DNA-binding protein
MPIYMDRHDVSETVTAEHVAQLHQQDLKIQDQFGCRGLTYWFDDKRKTAFCLIEAPDKQALVNMHNKAHGQIPHKIIEVDAGIVESFLGRIEDPRKSRNKALNIINDPAFRTIIKIEFLIRESQEDDKVGVLDLVQKDHFAIEGILKSYKGNIVKQNAKNGYLVSFNSVSRAVRAAIDVHALLTHSARQNNASTSPVKICLNAGVPVTEKGMIFEDTIKVLDRICAALPGEIIMTSEVKELYDSENLKRLEYGNHIKVLSPVEEVFLDNLTDYTEKNWNNSELKADDFCRSLGLSKSQLYRKMVALVGKSPNAFIKEYRLEKALKLLTKKSNNITEIAFQTGFSSQSYFSKCFQKRYGQVPSGYMH